MMMSMNGKGKTAIREAMPQTAAFLDALRDAMEAIEPGSSAGTNRNMARAARGARNLFHFTETNASGASFEIGAR